jgi:hypothetical protein
LWGTLHGSSGILAVEQTQQAARLKRPSRRPVKLLVPVAQSPDSQPQLTDRIGPSVDRTRPSVYVGPTISTEGLYWWLGRTVAKDDLGNLSGDCADTLM